MFVGSGPLEAAEAVCDGAGESEAPGGVLDGLAALADQSLLSQIEDPGGDAVELAWDGSERTVRIDGEPTLAGVPELERLGASRHRAYVVTATRLVGSSWEVAVAPL